MFVGHFIPPVVEGATEHASPGKSIRRARLDGGGARL
jgi:hypothetical protein